MRILKNCLICKCDSLQKIGAGVIENSVTSDCKPWSKPVEIHVCEKCGHIQKMRNQEWRDDVSQIYSGYEMYSLSDGCEQLVFEDGSQRPRSQKVIEKLSEEIDIPESGDLLDVGCGNGGTLVAFNRLFPKWRLAGFEIDDKFSESVSRVVGVEDFYSGSLDKIDKTFDMITLIQVIEHLENPVEVLGELREMLNPCGVILIQAPDSIQNPFDFLIVDHCSHFTKDALAIVVEKSGFEIITLSGSWERKSLCCVASLGAKPEGETDDAAVCTADIKNMAENSFELLEKVQIHASDVSAFKPVGILGTAIAGTWIASVINGRAKFFVDEDMSKAGKAHMGLPILSLQNLVAGDRVYLPFPAKIATELKERLSASHPSIDFIIPTDG